MAPRKQIIVSNRLPVRPVPGSTGWDTSPNSGGLITALAGLAGEVKFEWTGWVGADVPGPEQSAVQELFRRRFNYNPVFLSDAQIDRFYNGFCNSVLWPLFHYSPSRVDFSLPYWDEYRRVNELFAEVVLDQCSDDDLVWVHDFHLFLLPQLLRQERPHLRIGFFLHIPFPSSEIYRLLPVRKELLWGILGSDLVGFHTPDYCRHFSASCLRVLGLPSSMTDLSVDGRRVSYGSYPIGINTAMFDRAGDTATVASERAELQRVYRNRKLIVGVDRIDYSKGLILKLEAFERFLDKYPRWQGEAVLVQIAVPSRTLVPEYRRLKNELDRLVGRINGRFGTADYTPIQYLAHDVAFEEMTALYEVADACLVTSVRDGMNLVALEYTACQRKGHGVLILSEFCGAASSLGSALVVNPWDRDSVADEIHRALSMEPEEKRERAMNNYRYVRDFDSRSWARRFLRDLEFGGAAESNRARDLREDYFRMRSEFRNARTRFVFLDYDGTVVDLAEDPNAVAPTPELLDLISRLSKNPRNSVHIISGREPSQLDRWFGGLDLGLAAEHGMFLKDRDAPDWVQMEDPPLGWMQGVGDILEDFRRRTPGSSVERKRTGLAWHYRGVEEAFGERQSLELVAHLEEMLSNVPVSVLQGSKVIEVRPQVIHKGKLVTGILARAGLDAPFILCMGDDTTDEDMFVVLPGTAWTCRIGERHTQARYYLPSPAQVNEMLTDLALLE